MIRTVVVKNGARMQFDKSAMVVSATTKDRYQIGDHWFPFEVWVSNRAVDRVAHFERHESYTGELLEIRDEDSKAIVGVVQVAEIRSIMTSDLTAADVAELGYSSIADLHATHPGLGERKLWLFRVIPVRGDRQQ